MMWGTTHDTSIEKLQKVQGSLTVDLIMVPRAEFQTCSPTDTAAEVKLRNEDHYSFIPVLDDRESVVGLYDAERWFVMDAPDVHVADDFLPLSEDIVIAADASIFDFIIQADQNPTNLVISGSRIAGLVSLSDLQQLPVRASLFALITSFEMAMGEAIERRWPEPRGWMGLLSDGRREILERQISKSRNDDGFVSEITFTQIHDKADIICKSKLLSQSRSSASRTLREIRELRDDVAHANHYAHSPDEARKICDVVRKIFQFKTELLKNVDEMMPNT